MSMYSKKQDWENPAKRSYSPQFTETSTVTIRRLAWYLNIPMTKTIDLIIKELSLIFNSKEVCTKCKDKTKCALCAFNVQAITDNSKIAA